MSIISYITTLEWKGNIIIFKNIYVCAYVYIIWWSCFRSPEELTCNKMIQNVWPDENKDVEYQRDLFEPSRREGIELATVHWVFVWCFTKTQVNFLLPQYKRFGLGTQNIKLLELLGTKTLVSVLANKNISEAKKLWYLQKLAPKSFKMRQLAISPILLHRLWN